MEHNRQFRQNSMKCSGMLRTIVLPIVGPDAAYVNKNISLSQDLTKHNVCRICI